MVATTKQHASCYPQFVCGIDEFVRRCDLKLDQDNKGRVSNHLNIPGDLLSHNYPMKTTFPPTPIEKEVQRLHARGKAPDIIAIRLGMKMSKVLSVIALMAKI